MNSKLGLYIGGRQYYVDIDMEDDFAPFLKMAITKDLSIDGNNDVKKLLHAYVRKNHELYIQNKKIKKITKQLEI